MSEEIGYDRRRFLGAAVMAKAHPAAVERGGSGRKLTCPDRVSRYARYPQAQDSVVLPSRSVPNRRGSPHSQQCGAPPSATIASRPRLGRDRLICGGR